MWLPFDKIIFQNQCNNYLCSNVRQFPLGRHQKRGPNEHYTEKLLILGSIMVWNLVVNNELPTLSH